MALQLSQAAVSQTRTTTPNHFLTTHEAEIKAMSQRMVGASLASEAYTGTGLRALPFEYIAHSPQMVATRENVGMLCCRQLGPCPEHAKNSASKV
jgi:hypothetical protein